VAPGRVAISGAACDGRVIVELVIPDDEVEVSVVDFVEGSANRIGEGVAEAVDALLESLIFAAGVDELLAES
jgi:hypothetical protein